MWFLDPYAPCGGNAVSGWSMFGIGGETSGGGLTGWAGCDGCGGCSGGAYGSPGWVAMTFSSCKDQRFGLLQGPGGPFSSSTLPDGSLT